MDGILVSGATGFLGSAIVEELILTTNSPIYVLVRGRDGRTPEQRLESLWCERPVLHSALANRIRPLEGDIESEMLGLGRDAYDKLANEVSNVIHSAAMVGVNETRQRFWNANVVGTANMLDFAKRAIELGGLGRLVHVSSSYVAGQARGRIEEELFVNTDFNSLYEQSKHDAELLVYAYGEEGVPYTIVRPAQIIGDSRTGFITTFNTLYYPLKLYLKGRLPVIPASRDLIVNMAPVDYVARIVCRAIGNAQAEGQVLNAVPPEGSAPRLGDLLDSVRLWASENLGVALPAPVYLPAGELASAGRRRNMREDDHPKAKSPLRNLAALGPYFFEDRVFETARAGRCRRALPRLARFLPAAFGIRRAPRLPQPKRAHGL